MLDCLTTGIAPGHYVSSKVLRRMRRKDCPSALVSLDQPPVLPVLRSRPGHGAAFARIGRYGRFSRSRNLDRPFHPKASASAGDVHQAAGTAGAIPGARRFVITKEACRPFAQSRHREIRRGLLYLRRKDEERQTMHPTGAQRRTVLAAQGRAGDTARRQACDSKIDRKPAFENLAANLSFFQVSGSQEDFPAVAAVDT
jgi:hypothetical protein